MQEKVLCSEQERAEECGAYHMNIIMPCNFFDHTNTALKEFRCPVHKSAGFVGVSAAGCNVHNGNGVISWCTGGQV